MMNGYFPSPICFRLRWYFIFGSSHPILETIVTETKMVETDGRNYGTVGFKYAYT